MIRIVWHRASRTDINVDVAISACSAEISKPGHSARSDYQMGRALLAKDDARARRQFELAVSKGYRAARIDLANLLVDASAGSPIPPRGVALRASVAGSGVPIAAFELGHLYEYGAAATDRRRRVL